MSAFIAGLGGALLTMHQENVNYGSNFAPFAALFWLVLVVSLGSRTVEGAAQAGAAFALFDAILLKGAVFGWIFRSPDRIPGFFPLSPKWRFILFGLATIQFARHPEGLVENGKRRAHQRAEQALARVRRTGGEPPPAAPVRAGARRGDGRMSPPVLEATDIAKSFAGIVALDDVSLAVQAGERVGLIGPNGAGKTTFFNCVLGVIRPDHGTVRLDGEDISRLPVHARARRGIGRTFQRIELFAESTVREHLLIAERTRRGDGRLWRDLLGLGRPRPDELAACDEVLELLGPRRPRRRADRAPQPRAGSSGGGGSGADDPAEAAAARRAVVRPRPPGDGRPGRHAAGGAGASRGSPSCSWSTTWSLSRASPSGPTSSTSAA